MRRPFTLLEIMLVMVLVAMMAGLFGVMGGRLMRQERFRADTDLVLDQLRLAQNLMLILDADVQVRLEQKENLYQCAVVTDKPLPQNFSSLINRYYPLESIAAASFARPGRSSAPITDLQLRFYSRGSLIDAGTLRLQPSPLEGSDDVVVRLSGLPRDLFPNTPSTPFDLPSESRRWYPQEVLAPPPAATPDGDSNRPPADQPHNGTTDKPGDPDL